MIDQFDLISKGIQRIIVSLSVFMIALGVWNFSKKEKFIEKDIYHYVPENKYDYYETKSKETIDSIRNLPREQQDSIYAELADRYYNKHIQK